MHGCQSADRRTVSPSVAVIGERCYSRSLFFFQAEDGIRDDLVTGVQTCALPIYPADALNTIVGKNAARAIPICSFDSATRRSAAAMSGLRSRSCEGSPTEIAGGST